MIVREPVVTSGRKLRTHSSREMLGVFAKAIMHPSAVKGREGLEFFYGPRRPDPFVQPAKSPGADAPDPPRPS